jgi:hypothetical protein
MGVTSVGSGDRAQMILVGALALAIVLVGIALVLNSAIFAENLATRANQDGTQQASTFQQESAVSVGGAMHHHNHNNSSHASYTELNTGLNDSIRSWSSLNVRDSARKGRYVDVDIVSATNGTRIAQDNSSEFTPQDDGLLDDVVDLMTDSSWAVTPKDYQVRDFTMTVERDEIGDSGTTLYTEADVSSYLANLTVDASISVSATPYTVLYDLNDNGNYEHAVSIYRYDDGDGDEKDVKLTYYNTSTGDTTTCEIVDAAAEFDIDVSGGEVEGGDGTCDEVFDFQSETDDPYQLVFVEGEEIEGDYELVVDTERGAMESDYEDDGGLLDLFGLLSTFDFESYYDDHASHDDTYAASSPFVEPAIYSTEVGVDYRSDSVDYNSTVRVAPNEP